MCIDVFMSIHTFAADVGLIVGCIVGAVAVLAVAMILAIVALYCLKKGGGKVSNKKENSNDIDDIDSNFFASMPPFTGSML